MEELLTNAKYQFTQICFRWTIFSKTVKCYVTPVISHLMDSKPMQQFNIYKCTQNMFSLNQNFTQIYQKIFPGKSWGKDESFPLNRNWWINKNPKPFWERFFGRNWIAYIIAFPPHSHCWTSESSEVKSLTLSRHNKKCALYKYQQRTTPILNKKEFETILLDWADKITLSWGGDLEVRCFP